MAQNEPFGFGLVRAASTEVQAKKLLYSRPQPGPSRAFQWEGHQESIGQISSFAPAKLHKLIAQKVPPSPVLTGTNATGESANTRLAQQKWAGPKE